MKAWRAHFPADMPVIAPYHGSYQPPARPMNQIAELQ